MEVAHADESEQGKARFACEFARPAPAHLLIEDAGTGEAVKHQIDHGGAIKAGVKHVDRDENLRERLFLEPLYHTQAVRRILIAHAGDDKIGIAHIRRILPIGKGIIKHFRQRFGMAFVDGKHNGLANERLAQNALAVRKAMIQHLPELAHNGAVAFWNGEPPFQGRRVNGDRVAAHEKRVKFRPRFGIHRRPVQFTALDPKATFCGGLDRQSLVNMVRHKEPIADGIFQFVAECRFIDLEKPQGVAHEKPVFVVVEFRLRGAGRGGQADLYPVEMFQYPAPFPVNAAVTLINDNQVEIPRRIIAIDIDHALQRGDGDPLFVLKAATGAEDIGRIIA